MLPKVATHILHTTSRAAASIQHQTHTIRNVLQLQSSSGPSSGTGHLAPWNTPGSSHWGSNGPGPGGAKHNTGSRFNNGYSGAARAVTQANTISSNDGSFSQADDVEEVPRHPSIRSTKRTRIRSHSLSIPHQERNERGEKLGVLKTVQLHARSRHAFAASTVQDSVATPSAPADIGNPRPTLVRRNSTSAPLPLADTFDPTVPAPRVPVRRNSTAASEASSAKNVEPPPPPPSPARKSSKPLHPRPTTPTTNNLSPDTIRLTEARDSGDPLVAAEAVRNFRQNATSPSVREYNAALEALNFTRRPGESMHLILETYNEMLQRSLYPNVFTYVTLIDALTERDYENQKVIHALHMRVKNCKLTGRYEATSEEADQARIKSLESETNFASAMSLFETVVSISGNGYCSNAVYSNLLRSCAAHGSVDSAIFVFDQMEKREGFLLAPPSFRYMIQAYANAGKLSGAEDVFTEYQAALRRGGIFLNPAHPASSSRVHLQVWNQMIETYFRFSQPDKAVGLVDQMMSYTPDSAEPAHPPPVASSTFTTVLAGFCQLGDVTTALAWFDRLLEQSKAPEDPYEALGTAVKPDSVAWVVMIDALATHGMIHDLNRLFYIRLKDGNEVKVTERLIVFTANMAHRNDLSPEQFAWSMEFLLKHVIATYHIPSQERELKTREIINAFLERKQFEAAVSVLVYAIDDWMQNTSQYDVNGRAIDPAIHTIQKMQLDFTKQLYERTKGVVPFIAALQLARLADKVRVMQQEEYTPFFLQSYALSRAQVSLPVQEMTHRDWELLLYAAVEVETAAIQDRPIHTEVPQYTFQGVVSLLGDLNTYQIPFNELNPVLITRVVGLLSRQYQPDQLSALFKTFGPSFANVLDDGIHTLALEPSVQMPRSDSGYPSPDFNANSPLQIDPAQTKAIHSDFKAMDTSAEGALRTFKKFREGIENGKAPLPPTIGILIQQLGRVNKMMEVHYAYTAAQAVLKLLDHNKSWQADAWFVIEDSMVIALAHHGDVEGAHIHRMRILDQGGAPTADAYGALIYNVKDTTDDASNAMTLFQESQQLGVTPNQYLYNNIISKLARARKADFALELFQQMKNARISPSSVTYGAVIGACARIGDIHMAERLFAEMVKSKSFKPRVPPYNTMMQLYTTTKPNRERALYFYDELRNAGVTPTAYTYKLLMDAYGAIEPVDIESMERVFKGLQAENAVAIQGNHFATLINAYGCVQKDLAKAIEVFESIPSYSRAQPVDAVVFEAMINALVAHRRTDLIPEYIEKMKRAGVHMTAYIANFLIKGYAMAGDIAQSRSIFESLEDPAEGMAAPNNHTPHDSSRSPVVHLAEPVYREPSTWEAMVRAELGSGNRQGALDLLERIKARRYPEAVYNRISGIMVDHSMVLS